jgi:hypothetical protein
MVSKRIRRKTLSCGWSQASGRCGQSNDCDAPNAQNSWRLRQQTSTSALGLQYRDSFGVEGNKFFRAQPVPFIGDHASKGNLSDGKGWSQPK